MLPGTCFAGWREDPIKNFPVSPLPLEISDLLVRISTSRTRKGLQGPNLESREAGGTTFISCFVKNSWKRSASVSRRGTNFAATQHICSCRSKLGGTNFYRFLLLRQLHGQLGSDFDESQQAVFQHDCHPLTWKAFQILGVLQWTFYLF
jgi:hypothetical protein